MLAADPEGYRAAFRLLRDPQARSRIARQAHEYCLDNFTLDHIIDRWIIFFTSLEARADTGAVANLRCRHSMGVLKAHSALRLSRECWWWHHRVTYQPPPRGARPCRETPQPALAGGLGKSATNRGAGRKAAGEGDARGSPRVSTCTRLLACPARVRASRKAGTKTV